MANNYYKNYINKRRVSSKLYIFLLYLSFLWANFFYASSTLVENFIFSYGNLFSLTNDMFFYNFLYIIMYAGMSLLMFEAAFWIYRTILSYKVYTFVVPADKFRIDCRMFFAIRNIFYGIFANMCFLYPFLSTYLELISVVSIIIIVIVFAYHVQKTYSEPLIAHFVFKNFSMPVIVYEIILTLYYLWRCL